MGFKKGQSGNPAGKPAGIKDRKTILWDSFVEHSLSGGLSKFQEEMETLEGKEYVHAYLTLLEFMKPKRARVDENGDSAINLLTVIPPKSKTK